MSRTRQRTPEQTRAALVEQLTFLAVSTHAYDSSYEPEAKRMATVLATLLKNIGGKSMVEQLGMSNVKFPVAAMFPVLDKKILAGLTLDIFRPWVDLVPPFQASISLQNWFELPVLRSPTSSVSRLQLISALRNQEGGGHFAPSFKNDEVRDFIENGGLPIYQTDFGIVLSSDGSGKGFHYVRATPPGLIAPIARGKIGNAHFAAMRTMVTEVVLGLAKTAFEADVRRIFYPFFDGSSNKRHEGKTYVRIERNVTEMQSSA